MPTTKISESYTFLPPCSPGPTPFNRKGGTLLPKHPRRGIERQRSVHIGILWRQNPGKLRPGRRCQNYWFGGWVLTFDNFRHPDGLCFFPGRVISAWPSHVEAACCWSCILLLLLVVCSLFAGVVDAPPYCEIREPKSQETCKESGGRQRGGGGLGGGGWGVR